MDYIKGCRIKYPAPFMRGVLLGECELRVENYTTQPRNTWTIHESLFCDR